MWLSVLFVCDGLGWRESPGGYQHSYMQGYPNQSCFGGYMVGAWLVGWLAVKATTETCRDETAAVKATEAATTKACKDGTAAVIIQVVIWWAGLMRGAVSIALAFNQFTVSGMTWNPVEATMITNIIILILFSTTIFGILTKPLIGWIIPHHMRRCVVSDPSFPKERAFDAEWGLPVLSQNEPNQGNAHYEEAVYQCSYKDRLTPFTIFGGNSTTRTCDQFLAGEDLFHVILDQRKKVAPLIATIIDYLQVENVKLFSSCVNVM